MMRRWGSHSLIAALCTLALAWSARAELKYVGINGWYDTGSMPRVSRVAKPLPLPDPDAQPPAIHLSLDASKNESRHYRRSAWAQLNAVEVPEPFILEGKYDWVQTFLCFWVRVSGPEGNDDDPVYMEIETEGYRIFNGYFQPGAWQPRLADLSPWAGKTIPLTIKAVHDGAQEREVVIGLPRIVSCHGPYYGGMGGLGTPPRGPHGMPFASRTVHIRNCVEDPDGALAIARLDCVTRAEAVLTLGEARLEASLPEGIHWLPLSRGPFADESLTYKMTKGTAERGLVLVVPDFLAHDRTQLAQIQPKTAPMEPGKSP